MPCAKTIPARKSPISKKHTLQNSEYKKLRMEAKLQSWGCVFAQVKRPSIKESGRDGRQLGGRGTRSGVEGCYLATMSKPRWCLHGCVFTVLDRLSMLVFCCMCMWVSFSIEVPAPHIPR